MIADRSGRYALGAPSPTTLWRYDHRWRKVGLITPADGERFEFVEGDGHALVARHFGNRTALTVHNVAHPHLITASAVYQDNAWEFEGDRNAWAFVPEYVMLPGSSGRRSLIRIADDVVADSLDELGAVNAVIAVPDSRLVVLAGGGAVTVYDPFARQVGVRLKLEQGTADPVMRFRNGDSELWLNDGDTIMKLETKTWTVIDAAGAADASEASDAVVDDNQLDRRPIKTWSFSAAESKVLMVREHSPSLLVIDADSLELLHEVVLDVVPADAVFIGETKVLAVSADGRAVRKRLS